MVGVWLGAKAGCFSGTPGIVELCTAGSFGHPHFLLQPQPTLACTKAQPWAVGLRCAALGVLLPEGASLLPPGRPAVATEGGPHTPVWHFPGGCVPAVAGPARASRCPQVKALRSAVGWEPPFTPPPGAVLSGRRCFPGPVYAPQGPRVSRDWPFKATRVHTRCRKKQHSLVEARILNLLFFLEAEPEGLCLCASTRWRQNACPQSFPVLHRFRRVVDR